MVEIDIGPNMLSLGVFVLSWHGLFGFISVATAVYLVARWAPLRDIDPDTIYSIAIWAIIGGILGARIVHVADHWDFYQHNPGRIVAIWAPGIAIWGGVLGGLVGGASYAIWAKHPVGIIADLTAPALLFVQTIGRIGDIINGEHCAKATDFVLGFVWTNTDSNARYCDNGLGISVQPAIAYEMVWNMIALFIVWRLRGRLKPDGMLFVLYLAIYAVGRLTVMFLREQDIVYALGLVQAQYIALIVLVVTVPLLAAKARFTSVPETGHGPSLTPLRGTRAERRRQDRR